MCYNQFLNSESSESNSIKTSLNSSKGILQRIKGKKGRFRGNLSGKRVEYSARTVISPDPNLRLDQVAIPKYMAMNLTFPERVTRLNIRKLKHYLLNGRNKYPGANYASLRSKPADKFFLANNKVQQMFIDNLQFGDVVHRHLVEDDVVLFNR